MPTTVAIVEDSAGICQELQYIITQAAGLSCICACRNAASALQRIPAAAPDVIVMDIHLPDGSGIDCTAKLKRQLPDTQILMFTIHDDTEQIVRAMEAGASGYLLKNTTPAEIVAAIRDVRTHGAPLSREVARKLVDSFRVAPAVRDTGETLTPRENEILTLLAAGLLYKEIAERLGIKLDTVGTHLKSIYRKLHVRSRTEAVIKHLR
jgi:DNA-binding NarL/FixJ family response regulator